ncbi:MAG: TonB-dependent receptor [Bacteroidia bacterium]|nr:TonB-dependent receptor [Bacteroidia bacterium]
MLKLLTLILISISFSLSAQQTFVLKGKVTSPQQHGVGFASVSLGKYRTRCDSTGGFEIKVPSGKYTIRITAIGYKIFERRIEILSDISLPDFQMEMEINQLNQVVFSGGKISRKAAQEVMSMTVVRPNLIAYTNATDLSEVVNKVPGVSIVEGQITIRGGVGYSYSVGSRVMVLLDDMPLMGGDLGDVRWKILPIEAAEQVEVVKGASSVLYGSSALNGSVNVRTGWAEKKPVTKFTMYQGITDNPRNREMIWWERTSQPFTTGAFFSHRQMFGQFDLVLSGNVSMTRSHLQLNDEFRGRYYIKTRYRSKKIPGLSFGVNSMMLLEKAGRFFIWENSDSGAFKPYDGSVGQDFWRIYTIDPHITYESPNKKTTHSVKLRNYNIVRFVDRNLNRNLYNANADQYSLDYSWQQKLSKRITSTTGLWGLYTTAVSNVYAGRYQGYSYAGFIQLDYQYKRWNISAGLRYEVNRIDTNEENRRPLTKIGFNYRLAPQTFLRMNYGEGYRFPTIGERYVDDGVVTLRVFPNPGLKTEYGWTAEFGLKQGFSILNWNAQFDYAFFWQEYNDLIEFRFDQYVPASLENPFGTFGFKALNIQQARVAGMEFSLSGNGNIGDVNVNVLAGYTYSYPVNLSRDTAARNAGRYLRDFFRSLDGVDSAYAAEQLLPYRNRNLVKGDIELSYKKVNLGYGVQYYSRFDNIDQMLYVVIPGLQNYMRSVGNGDWVHQLRTGVNVNPNFTVSFIINNFTNKAYATRPARMDAPRTFILQARVNF